MFDNVIEGSNKGKSCLVTVQFYEYPMNKKVVSVVILGLFAGIVMGQSSSTGISEKASAYIDSVVDIMRRDALHRNSLDFDAIRDSIVKGADGAITVGDTHRAIKRSTSLLQDHHSYFISATEVREQFGLSEADIEQGKSGKSPSLEASKLDSLALSLDYTESKLLDGGYGYIKVPSFENLYEQGMRMLADSLQRSIRKLDSTKLRGWIIDLRDNDGGNMTPMISGLGPLLDNGNEFFTVDESGRPNERAFYSEGSFYIVRTDEEKGDPILRSKISYMPNDPSLPVAVLTGFKTASSAEAVVAIFAGQSNVKIVGAKTNGLTSTNSFNFLPDNSVLNLTIGYYADRNKKIYRQGIEPDIQIESEGIVGTDPSTDNVLARSIRWIDGYKAGK